MCVYVHVRARSLQNKNNSNNNNNKKVKVNANQSSFAELEAVTCLHTNFKLPPAELKTNRHSLSLNHPPRHKKALSKTFTEIK